MSSLLRSVTLVLLSLSVASCVALAPQGSRASIDLQYSSSARVVEGAESEIVDVNWREVPTPQDVVVAWETNLSSSTWASFFCQVRVSGELYGCEVVGGEPKSAEDVAFFIKLLNKFRVDDMFVARYSETLNDVLISIWVKNDAGRDLGHSLCPPAFCNIIPPPLPAARPRPELTEGESPEG